MLSCRCPRTAHSRLLGKKQCQACMTALVATRLFHSTLGGEREEPLGGGDLPPALGSFISSAQVSSSHSAHGCDFSARASEEVSAFVLFSVMTRISLILCTVTWKLGRHKYIKAALKKKGNITHTTLLHWVLTSSSLLGSKREQSCHVLKLKSSA